MENTARGASILKEPKASSREKKKNRIPPGRNIAHKKRMTKQFDYSSFFNFYMDAIALGEVNGILIDVNPACCEMLGYSKDEIVSRRFSDFYVKEDLDAEPHHLNEASAGKYVRTERRLIRSDGSIIFVDILCRGLPNGRLLATLRDITAQKKAEEEVRNSEAQLESLFENSPSPIAFVHKRVLVRGNRMFLMMFGYAKDEIIGKSALVLIAPECQSQLLAAIAGREAGDKSPLHFTTKGRRKNGDVFDLEIDTTLCTIGGKEYSIVHHRDITDLKRAVATLHKRENRLRRVLDATPFPVAIVNVKKDRIFYWSRSALELFGHTADTLSQWYRIAYPDPDYQKRWIEQLESSYETIRQSPHAMNIGERRITCKDGSIRVCEIYIAFIGDNTIVTYNDITLRKQTEEALNKAQKLEALGVLAGGIAHDFNNLMGGVFGFIDLARGYSKDPVVSEFLGKAMSGIERARGLTQQLLTFSTGGAPIRKVGSLFPCIKESVQFALSGSNVTCTFDVPDTLLPCNFDENQIMQVVDNIVINALHAMPLGGAIELTARNVAIGEKGHPKLPKGDYAKISIKDHGIGIPEELLSRIFDPFFTTKTKGHGLGLATSYSIIHRHAGAIEVESEPGKGSTFHIYLPAATESVVNEAVPNAEKHRGSGVFIVMDDDEALREALGSMFKVLGYTAAFARNGKEALNVLAETAEARRPLAGIILDLTVPGGMGGKETIAEIRKIDPEIPAFVASGYADDPVMQNPADFGFTASIRKPFTMSELAGVLSIHVKKF
jgi:PAS domain S-box-containing protein